MLSKRTAIARWTGRGSLDDLLSSVGYVLGLEGIRARVSTVGGSLTVEGTEPAGVAAAIGKMPGVAWVAAGLTARSQRELSSGARTLARRYLRRGERFAVGAEGTGGVVAADLVGVVTSSVLDEVRGAKVSIDSPKARFRAAFDGTRGVVGVEIASGPGGVPTGKEEAVCFVSGGIHSSVVALGAVVQGYRARLVHARYSEESLRAVAKLYSELSYRADPRGLSLEVLEGGSVTSALSGYSRSDELPIFTGHTPTSPGRRRLPNALAPLYLAAEERFAEDFEELGFRAFSAPEDWERENGGERKVRRFGGRRADVSGILDGLR